MSNRYDVIILGGGNAGLGVSAVLARSGKRLAFVENRDFGGTCPNRGCTPKKVFVAAGHALHEIGLAREHGIEVSAPALDWAQMVDRTQAMIGHIPDAMMGVAESRGDVYRGTARFVAPDTVEVDMVGADRVRLTADHFVIATGSAPRSLNIPGAEHLSTSEDVLSDRSQPQDLVFIGGGVIAMEFSHIYARAGTRVTILEALPTLLPRMEADAVAVLAAESERLGITIETGVVVSAVDRVGDRLRVRFDADGESRELLADKVVNGTGRVANVAGLDLDVAGVSHDGGRIEVAAGLRSTSNPRVWVAGDALAISAQLSPLATEEGQLVGRNILGADEVMDYSVIPSAVYTVPALASVGLTQTEAQATDRRVRVATHDMADWFSAQSYAEPVAWAKVLVDEDSDAIVGAHLVGHRAEELVHLFALAMQHGISAVGLKESRFAFPTFSADVRNLL